MTATGGAQAPTRVAVIGAGQWGQQHARVFSAHPASLLCAVVARRRERAEERAAQWGARPYTSIGEMLASERPDLVTMSLPNEGHFEATLEVIEAGVPLLVEKPLVFDLAQADELIEAASVGWPLERMAVIDRLVLRLAVAELLEENGPPVAVVIDEAVELAKTYSTDDSGGFVNGVLSTVARQVRP